MKDTGVEYAVKIMEKRFIRKEKKVKFVMMERKVFSKVTHDRIVKLFFTFQVGMPTFRSIAGCWDVPCGTAMRKCVPSDQLAYWRLWCVTMTIP